MTRKKSSSFQEMYAAADEATKKDIWKTVCEDPAFWGCVANVNTKHLIHLEKELLEAIRNFSRFICECEASKRYLDGESDGAEKVYRNFEKAAACHLSHCDDAEKPFERLSHAAAYLKTFSRVVFSHYAVEANTYKEKMDSRDRNGKGQKRVAERRKRVQDLISEDYAESEVIYQKLKLEFPEVTEKAFMTFIKRELRHRTNGFVPKK